MSWSPHSLVWCSTLELHRKPPELYRNEMKGKKVSASDQMDISFLLILLAANSALQLGVKAFFLYLMNKTQCYFTFFLEISFIHSFICSPAVNRDL